MASPKTPAKSTGPYVTPGRPSPRRGLVPVSGSATPRLGYGPERPPVRTGLPGSPAPRPSRAPGHPPTTPPRAAPIRKPAHPPTPARSKPIRKPKPLKPARPLKPLNKARPVSSSRSKPKPPTPPVTGGDRPKRVDAAAEARYAAIRDRVKARGGTVNELYVRRTDAKNVRRTADAKSKTDAKTKATLRDKATGRQVGAFNIEHRSDMKAPPPRSPRAGRRPATKAPPRSGRRP